MYPDSNIWIIGHSLGGALASLLGATYGAPVVTFESPGESMAASRLHLPSPVSLDFALPESRNDVRPFAAFDPPHYTRIPHRRPDSNGDLYWHIIFLRPGRICHGISVRSSLTAFSSLQALD